MFKSVLGFGFGCFLIKNHRVKVFNDSEITLTNGASFENSITVLQNGIYCNAWF